MANLKSLSVDGNLILEKATGTQGNIDTSSTMFADSTARGLPHTGATEPAVVFNPNVANQFVVAYVDTGDGNKGKVVCGTVYYQTLGGNTKLAINWGAVALIAPGSGTSTVSPSIAFDGATNASANSLNRFVVAYRDAGDSNYSKVVVMQYAADLTISRGPVKTVASVHAQTMHVAFDPNTLGRFVITYWSATSTPAVSVCTINSSTNVITVGTALTSNGGDDNGIVFWDTNTASRFIWAGRLTHVSNQLWANIGQVSGTTVTWNGSTRLVNADCSHISGAWDPSYSGRFVIAYSSPFNGTRLGKAVAAIVSGSAGSWTFGNTYLDPTEYTFNNASTEMTSISFSNIYKKFIIAYKDTANSNRGTAIVGTLGSGGAPYITQITYGSEVPFTAASSDLSFVGQSVSGNYMAGSYFNAYRGNEGQFVVVSSATADGAVVGDIQQGHLTIDVAAGNFFEVDLGSGGSPSNIAEDIQKFITNNVNATSSQISSFDLKIIGRGSDSPTFDAPLDNIKWVGGTAPTFTSVPNDAVDILRFTTYDNGTTWYGEVVGLNFT